MLFDASELTAPYLQILLNGKISTMPVASLFDCKEYDSLRFCLPKFLLCFSKEPISV